MPKQVFDVGAMLADEGLSLAGVSEKGDYMVNTPEGETVALDVRAMVKDLGADPDKFDLHFNTPDSALDVSPVSVMDRAKLAIGNTRGQVNYLKSKFEDAKFVEGQGLAVKNKGVWQRVDQSGMDPWELTKDVVEGAVNMFPGAAGATYGAAQGATLGAAGGPVGAAVGSVLGAGTGGTAVSQGIRSSLGRLVGTYQPTPEEELKDTALEFVLNAGGQAVALGAKPVLAQLGKAVKSITSAASPAAKEALIGVLGRTTGAGEVATRTLFENTDDVMKTVAKASGSAANSADAVSALKSDSIRHVESMLEEAPKALSRKFGELKDVLVNNVDDSLKANVGSLVKQAQNDWVEGGLGKWVSKGGATPKFQFLSDAEIAKRIGAGEGASMLDDATRTALENVNRTFEKFSKIGELKGKQAASALMELKRNVNAVARDVIEGGGATPTTEKFVTQFRQSLSQRVSDTFHAAGDDVARNYRAVNGLYERFADTVTAARRMAASENGSEVLLNKLVSGIGSNQTYKEAAGDLAMLLGAQGKEALKKIAVNHAAAGFVPVLPKSTLGQFTASMAGAGAALSGAVSAPVAAMGAAQASPRIVAKEVQYAKQLLGWMQSLKPAQRAAFLAHPTAVREGFKLLGESAMSEGGEAQQLLQEMGVGQ